MAHLGIVQKCCLLHAENGQNPFLTVINKHNCFEECVTNPLTFVNNSHHSFVRIHGKLSIVIGLKCTQWFVGQLVQSADHWLIPSSFILCCDFIINNKSSVSFGVSQITRTVYMLPLIRSGLDGKISANGLWVFISAGSNKQYINFSDRWMWLTWKINSALH